MIDRTNRSKFTKMDRTLTYMLYVVAKQAENELPALLEGTNLNGTGYRILAAVNAYDAVSISDLGRIMQIDRAQISRAAVTLEKQGYVIFADHPTNRRKKMVTLSDAGREVLAQVSPIIKARRERLEQALGPERTNMVLDALHTLSRAMPL